MSVLNALAALSWLLHPATLGFIAGALVVLAATASRN